jgi:hypothetical protein
VKSGRSGGQWTIQRLAREGILAHFESKLKADTDCTCVLVTEAPADALHGLTQAARSSSSLLDFESRLNEAQQIALHQVKAAWPNLTPDEVVAALARVHDVQWREEALRTLLTVELEALVEGPAEASLAVLAQYALDRLSGSVIAPDVWAHLNVLGMGPTDWAHDASVAQAVTDAVDRYLRPHREEAILGIAIPRAEADEVHRLLTRETACVVLVTGEGGIGKSAVAAQVVEALVGEGLPVLPLRVDLLAPTMLPRVVGEQLGFPGSPPAVLGAISPGRRSVLVLDQLDSVSLTSGRHPELWQCLREVIDEARYQPDMSVLIVCRRFDLENDDRLRTLRASDGGPATVMQVERLSDEIVGRVVASAGLSEQSLRPSQRELLSVPLHLRLLTLVASESSDKTLNFETAKDLYDRFWEHKRQRVAERMAPRTARWADVLVAACDVMSERESLSVPRSSLDAFADEVPYLFSEHVLVEESGRIAFFHQGFLDYVFARGFRSRAEDLLSFLLQTDQGLFRRAQVRQVLGFERDEEGERYVRDLEPIVSDSRIRFHLKRAALDYLMTVSDPSPEEWAILERAIASGGDIKRHILDLLSGSPAWFDLVVDQGTIPAWLSSEDDERINEAVTILGRIQRSRPARVAELLTPFVGASEEWNRRLLWLVQWADLTVDRSFLDFFLQLLETGAVDEARGPIAVNSDFWSLIYGLSKKHPDWACEVIGGYLNRRLRIANDAGAENPFDSAVGSIPETQQTKMIVEAAEGAPKAFVLHVLPFMLDVIDRTVDRSKPPPRHDPVWGFRYPGEADTLRGALLLAMEIALKGLAGEESDTFQAVVEDLGKRESETLDFLVLRGYLGARPELAEAAIDYLLAVPDRLHIGYASEGSWASRELLSWAIPACSPDSRERITSGILAYFPAWERSAGGRRAHGQCQYILLAGIPADLLTPEAKRRLQELERKFGTSVEAPARPEVFMVGSPIAEPSTERMTDKQWLKAMSKYSSDRGVLSRGAQGGGAVELSRALAQRAREDPGRFVALIEHAPNDLNPEYFSSVVGAAGDPASGADLTQLVRASRRADRLDGRPCGMAIARAVEQHASEEIPRELVEMVGRYALDDPDPATETWEERSTSGQQFYLGDVYTAGINSTRGAAAEAIAAILFSGGEHLPTLKSVLERLVEDSSISVRACAAKCLLALLNHDRGLAVDLFLRLADAREELLGTPYIERFLKYAVLTDFARVKSVIERMLASDIEDVARAGARQACLASLELDEAADLCDRCMAGGKALRSGAAEVFAANLRSAGRREVCEQSLRDLFNDPEADVSKAAAGCFQHLRGAELADFGALAMAFVESPAFEKGHFWLLQALEACDVALPDVTCRFAERFVEVAGAASGDISTSSAAHSGDVSQLLMRAYSQSGDSGTRSRVLDVIDQMSALRSYGLEAALAAFERL